MKTPIQKAFASATLCAPLLATAQVTWHFQGTIAYTDAPAPVSVGDAFFVELSFNPTASLFGSGGADGVFHSYDPSSISMTFGTANSGPLTVSWNGADVTGNLFLRDDSLFQGFAPRDVLRFELDRNNADDTSDIFQVVLRSFDLSLITNHALPADWDQRWLQGNWTLGGATGESHLFEVCLTDANCSGGQVIGNLTPVPEPGPAAVLMAGIGGLTALRRLRRQTAGLR